MNNEDCGKKSDDTGRKEFAQTPQQEMPMPFVMKSSP